MKTKVLKSVLPIIAIVFAMGLAFATEAKSTSQTGYYDDPFIPGVQSVTTDCVKHPFGDLCKTQEGYQLYATPELGSIENNELRKNN
ncbi:DUF6520 family protein [Gelidibacter japonicus]|uniref:DUF6520 family protein n=1 Tax=Gelidibacter japonicus TaxID=1962232 RepID=UPI0013D35755|nr:DUF6520 family protein [Gelidibacter japonicus]